MNTLYVARSTAIAARLLGDEVIVMSARDSTLFTLNPVATEIWEGADGQTSLAEIIAQRVCPKFDVDFDTAHRDAQTFVEELAGHGVLLVSDQPITPVPASPPGKP